MGSFNEIVHGQGQRTKGQRLFEAGFEQSVRNRNISFYAQFEARLSDPYPTRRVFSQNDAFVEIQEGGDGKQAVKFTDNTELGTVTYPEIVIEPFLQDETNLTPLRSLEFDYRRNLIDRERARERLTGSNTGNDSSFDSDQVDTQNHRETFSRLRDLSFSFRAPNRRVTVSRPFASAPVRSRPLRTYDPGRPSTDPEGSYVPTYLASVFHRDKVAWGSLRTKLEEFGNASGLFDEITIKPLGKSEGTPFQVQIRKYAHTSRRKGPQRNLIDVGYGVSQVLPLLTELLKRDGPSMFLLQQPEVHLHPRAQAELGSLFCTLAAARRQFIIETHSDYILDRVRIEIQKGNSRIKPSDISILYFEPRDLDVQIHSIRLDEMGNIRGAPAGYRQFFMEETRKSLGIGL